MPSEIRAITVPYVGAIPQSLSDRSSQGSCCQDLWKSFQRGSRSGQSITSLQFEADEIADGEQLVACRTAAAEAELAAHQVATRTSPLAQVALLARGALIDGLGDEVTLTTEGGDQIVDGRLFSLMARPVGPLPAGC